MANYVSRMRTSYFDVNDASQFKEAIEPFVKANHLEIIENEGKFGLMGEEFTSLPSPHILLDENGDQVDQDDEMVNVLELLQTFLPEDEVVIATLIGYEKMRYLVAASFIVTRSKLLEVHSDLAVKELAIQEGILTKEQANSLNAQY